MDAQLDEEARSCLGMREGPGNAAWNLISTFDPRIIEFIEHKVHRCIIYYYMILYVHVLCLGKNRLVEETVLGEF